MRLLGACSRKCVPLVLCMGNKRFCPTEPLTLLALERAFLHLHGVFEPLGELWELRFHIQTSWRAWWSQSRRFPQSEGVSRSMLASLIKLFVLIAWFLGFHVTVFFVPRWIRVPQTTLVLRIVLFPQFILVSWSLSFPRMILVLRTSSVPQSVLVSRSSSVHSQFDLAVKFLPRPISVPCLGWFTTFFEAGTVVFPWSFLRSRQWLFLWSLLRSW